MSYRSAISVFAVATVAAATPALAQAHHAPGDVVRAQLKTQPSSTQLNHQDELGPKYVNLHAPASAAPRSAHSPAGFDWRDAGAGLGSATVAAVLIAWVLVRRRRREAQPEQGSLAGA